MTWPDSMANRCPPLVSWSWPPASAPESPSGRLSGKWSSWSPYSARWLEALWPALPHLHSARRSASTMRLSTRGMCPALPTSNAITRKSWAGHRSSGAYFTAERRHEPLASGHHRNAHGDTDHRPDRDRLLVPVDNGAGSPGLVAPGGLLYLRLRVGLALAAHEEIALSPGDA